jgi:hypothetical protein
MALPLFSLLPRAWLALGAIGSGALIAAPLPAQNLASDQILAFDIPAQPLGTALTAYFRASGVQLLYDSSLAQGRRSSPVRGNYTPRQALALLLRGTGLVARYSRGNAAVLAPEHDATRIDSLVPLGRVVVRAPSEAPPPSAIQRLQYYTQLEDALQAHLRADRRTSRLTFDLHAAIRISAEGLIESIEIRDTGADKTALLVAGVLTGKPVVRPPLGISQPLLLRLRGRRSRGD